MRALAADAEKRGARPIVFPEAFVSAYPRGLAFGATVGVRTQEGREQFRTYWESAIGGFGDGSTLPVIDTARRVPARRRRGGPDAGRVRRARRARIMNSVPRRG